MKRFIKGNNTCYITQLHLAFRTKIHHAKYFLKTVK